MPSDGSSVVRVLRSFRRLAVTASGSGAVNDASFVSSRPSARRRPRPVRPRGRDWAWASAPTRISTTPAGDRLELSVSATNAGGAGVADFYTGVILPDGVTIATVGPGGSARMGTLATPAAFIPIASGIW